LTECRERQTPRNSQNKDGFDLTLAHPIAGIDISSTTLDVAVLHADGSFKASSTANSKPASGFAGRSQTTGGERYEYGTDCLIVSSNKSNPIEGAVTLLCCASRSSR
jgi:hypothetical protein